MVEWIFHLPRRLNNTQFSEFLLLTESLQLVHFEGVQDKLIWVDGKDVFSDKECHKRILELRMKLFQVKTLVCDWKKAGLAMCQRRLVFFWVVFALKKVLTLDNLRRRGFLLAERCPLCLKDGESIDHLFFRCSFSSSVWDYFLRVGKLSVMVFSSIPNLFFTWRRAQMFSSRGCFLWGLLRHAIVWTLWDERNRKKIYEEAASTEMII